MEQLCLPGPLGRQSQRCRNSWQGAYTGWTVCSRGCSVTCCWSVQMPLRLAVHDWSKGACKSVLQAGNTLLGVICEQGMPGEVICPQQSLHSLWLSLCLTALL